MVHSSWRIGAGLLRIVALIAAASPLVQAGTVQLDIIFPRNETYKQADVFPIAVAVHNHSLLPTPNSFHLLWDIMPYTRGVVPGGITYDLGNVYLPDNATDTDPLIMVATTNVTSWISQKRRGETYMLQVYPVWYDDTVCETLDDSSSPDVLMFSIETDIEATELSYDNITDTALPADVQNAPDCPLPFDVLEVDSVATATATATETETGTGTGTSASSTAACTASVTRLAASSNASYTYTVDAAAKSSIASLASSSATSSILATQTTSTATSSSTNAAVAAVRTAAVGPALAAMGIVYCIVY